MYDILAAQLWRSGDSQELATLSEMTALLCGTRSTKFGYLLDHNWISLDFDW